jgi:hypothetical protein
MSLAKHEVDPAARDFKVLVADDSPIYRKLAEHALAEKQYAVQNAWYYFFESSPLKWLSTSSRLSGFLASVNTTE